jgi:hypothetical protein
LYPQYHYNGPFRSTRAFSKEDFPVLGWPMMATGQAAISGLPLKRRRHNQISYRISSSPFRSRWQQQ